MIFSTVLSHSHREGETVRCPNDAEDATDTVGPAAPQTPFDVIALLCTACLGCQVPPGDGDDDSHPDRVRSVQQGCDVADGPSFTQRLPHTMLPASQPGCSRGFRHQPGDAGRTVGASHDVQL